MDPEVKHSIVELILNKQTEDALSLLSNFHKVTTPSIKIGLPKGGKKVYGCYVSKNRTIYLLNSDFLGNPQVILHEFYHHLRSQGVDKKHRGNEKNADIYALNFLKEYNIINNLKKAKQ